VKLKSLLGFVEHLRVSKVLNDAAIKTLPSPSFSCTTTNLFRDSRRAFTEKWLLEASRSEIN
jgi:hypothetical protein